MPRSVVSLICGLVILTGNACGAAGSPPPTPGGTLVVAIGAEPDALNVYLARVAESLLVANRTLPRLAREVVTPAGRQDPFEPELARAWSFQDGGLTLKIDLQEGARWSDGQPVTCEDLVFTLRAQTDPAVAWRGASIKRHIRAIDCPDPRTALVRFTKTYPGQFMDANDLHILPRSLKALPFDKWRGADWAKLLPAAGPFRVAAVRPGQEIVLEKNPAYWTKGRPYLDKVVLRVVPDPTGRVTGLLSGEFDVVETISPGDARRAAGQMGVTILRRPDWAYSYLGWNTLDPAAWKDYRRQREEACAAARQTPCLDDPVALAALRRSRPHPLFGDARVRRALTLAIDRQTIVDSVLAGEGEVPASPLLAGLPEHDPQAEPLPFDPAQAKALLRAAGLADGDGDGTLERNGRACAFDLLVQAGNAPRRGAAILIQQNLAAVGCAVRLVPVENSAFYPTLAQRGMDAWIGGWRASLRVDMTEMLHASACAAEGNNYGCWSESEADRLASAARDTTDDAARRAAWRRWEKIFLQEQPYTLLFRPTLLSGVRERVKGIVTQEPGDALHGIENWWLAPGPARP